MSNRHTGRPRMPDGAKKRARTVNLSPRADEALARRTGPSWGPTQAATAMIERYLEAMDRYASEVHPATVDMVDRALQGDYLDASSIGVLSAICGARDASLGKALAKLDYYHLCAIVDAVERRRANRE